MTDDVARLVDAVRRHYDDGCFACGRDNPIGLHLDDFDFEDGQVSARFTPRPEYRGAGITLHGGVAATALDEILVWAGILAEGVLSVTGNIGLRYRRPVHVDDPIVVSARVDERSGRRLRLSGAPLGGRRGKGGGVGSLPGERLGGGVARRPRPYHRLKRHLALRNTGRLRSIISAVPVKVIRKKPGAAQVEPGRTRTPIPARRRAKAASSASGQRIHR